MTLPWALKVTSILGLALAAVALSRGRAAAFRAALLTWTLAALLALPLVETVMPRWPASAPAPVSVTVVTKVVPDLAPYAAVTLDWHS